MKGGIAVSLAALAALRGVGLSGPVELAALVDEEETGKASAPTSSPRSRRSWAASPRSQRTCRPSSALVVRPTRASRCTERPVTQAIPTTVRTRSTARPQWSPRSSACTPSSRSGRTRCWGRPPGASARSTAVPVAHRACGMRGGGRPQTTAWRVTRIRARRSSRAGGGSAAGRPWFDGRRGDADGDACFQTPADSELARTTDAALADAGGPRLPLGGWTAACDGGFVARDLGIPVVVLGPGSATGQAHRADESVAVEELIVAARAYALTALRLLG